jgi:hypothetical protein
MPRRRPAFVPSRRMGLPILLSLFSIVALAACGDSDDGSSAARTAQFVGQTEDGSAVAFARLGAALIAYVCNDADVGEWFEGTSGPDLRELSAASGARIVLESTNAFSEGVFIDAGGNEHRFHTARAEGDEGLYLLFGGDAIDLTTRRLSEIFLEEVINNALVDLVRAHSEGLESPGFRAGWIVFGGDLVAGNITLPRSGLSPLGNQLPLRQDALAGTSLSVQRFAGVLGSRSPLDDVKKPAPADVPQSASPCGDNFDLSTAGCCSAIKFNSILVFVSNSLADSGLESETVDSLLNECAETIVDFCASAVGSCTT